MKPEEHGDDDEEGDLDEDTDDLDDEVDVDGLLLLGDGDDLLDEEGDLAAERVDEGENDIEEEEHKELSVAESDAVGDPGAVVVHVEDAALAGGAVVAPSLVHNYLYGLKLWQSRQ